MAWATLFGVVGNSLAVLGVLIICLAAVGLFRFPDTYQRISAVGTAAGVGIILIVIGVFILEPSWGNFVKLIAIILLQLGTSSIGTMAIARSAYLTGSPMKPGYFDHLAEDQTDPTESVAPDQDEPEDRPDDADPDDHTTRTNAP